MDNNMMSQNMMPNNSMAMDNVNNNKGVSLKFLAVVALILVIGILHEVAVPTIISSSSSQSLLQVIFHSSIPYS